jgi:hypothetical protein
MIGRMSILERAIIGLVNSSQFELVKTKTFKRNIWQTSNITIEHLVNELIIR